MFPTPLYDTRELVAWGRHFPLVTPVHPPMMVWAGGLVDRLFGPSGTAIVIANQISLAIGLVYLYATLRLLVDRTMAAYIVALTASSFYVVFGPLSWALNADILQLTSWPAVLYHFLRGKSTDRWQHWILLGVWAAIAALTKYNAVVLFIGDGGGRIVAVPSFRGLPAPSRALCRHDGRHAAVSAACDRGAEGTAPPSTTASGTSPASVRSPTRRDGSAWLIVGYLPLLLPGARGAGERRGARNGDVARPALQRGRATTSNSSSWSTSRCSRCCWC